MPRGFGSLPNHRLTPPEPIINFRCSTGSSVGRFLYIKRIKTSLFYDYSYAQIPAYNSQNELVSFVNRNYRSVGLELTSDMHLLRFFAPFEFGIRTSWLPQFNSLQSIFCWQLISMRSKLFQRDQGNFRTHINPPNKTNSSQARLTYKN
jgi:hypothetical protein